jgi:chemotaxis protein methyltransferase CheR
MSDHCDRNVRLEPLVGDGVSRQQYGQVVEILKKQQSFELNSYKDHCVRRRLAARIRAAGYQNADAYLKELRRNAAEQQALLTSLSIHVSQFFRNPSVFSALERRILPGLLGRSERGRQKLRIWSVGCACGEEAYSLALLCKSAALAPQEVSIIATDLSSEALKVARVGCYPEGRLKNLPAATRRECFKATATGALLDRGIRDRVRFFRHDILTDQPFYRADLILCRNLLIYFSRRQQQKVLEKLAKALLPGGFLVLGRAETLATSCRHLFDCIDPAERIYRRRIEE